MLKEKELTKLKVRTPLSERKYRVGNTWKREGKHFGMMLTYIDARYVQDVLDRIVGSANWSSAFIEIKGRLFCKITVRYLDENGDIAYVSKMDCGTESNVEKEKGEASDSFKRCAVHFGIGRDLYHVQQQHQRFYIVELKNGKPPFGWKPQILEENNNDDF